MAGSDASAGSTLKKPTFDLSFQFSKPPIPSDATVFGCDSRFNLPMMERENPESSGDNLPFSTKFIPSARDVIDLTDDDDQRSDGNDDNVAEVKLTPNYSTEREANSAPVDRPLPNCRPTPFSLFRPRCESHPGTPAPESQRRLWDPLQLGRITLGKVPLRGPHCITSFEKVPPRLFRP